MTQTGKFDSAEVSGRGPARDTTQTEDLQKSLPVLAPQASVRPALALSAGLATLSILLTAAAWMRQGVAFPFWVTLGAGLLGSAVLARALRRTVLQIHAGQARIQWLSEELERNRQATASTGTTSEDLTQPSSGEESSNGLARELRTVLDASSSMIGYWDKDLRNRVANRAYGAWFGVWPEQVAGQPIRTLLGEELFALNQPYIEGALRGQVQKFEREIPAPQGGQTRYSVAEYIPDIVNGEVRGFSVFVTDVTAIKQAQAAIAASEAKLRNFYDLSTLGLAMTDAQGRFIEVNRALLELTGYEEDELIGMDCHKLKPGKYLLDEQNQVAQLLQTGRFGPRELEYIRKDGSQIPVSSSGLRAQGGDGQNYFWRIFEDIRERRKSTETLELLQKCIAHTEDVILITEAEPIDLPGNRIIFVNDAFVRCTGYSREEALGNTPRMLQGPKTDRATLDRIRQSLGQWQPVRAELVNYTKSGTEFWIELSIVPIANDEGWFTHWIAVQRDITERKRAEEKIDRADRLMRTAMDAVDEAFAIFDADDLLLYCNDKYRNLYGPITHLILPGVSYETLTRKSAEQGIFVDCQGRMDAWISERLSMHRKGVQNWLQHLCDGRVLNISQRRCSTGELVVLSFDITGLYRAREVAEAANIAKSQFLSNMSHELRTPMNGVLGMAQLLCMPDVSESERVEYAKLIYQSGESLMTLLNGILDLAKVEAGKVELEALEVDPAQLLNDIQAHFNPAAEAKGLRIEVHASDTLGCYLADPTRLRQMLSNLMGNAIKFTREGFIRIEASQVDLREGNALLELRVSDSGIGIAPDKYNLLFQSFTQLDNTITREFGGTGLGLSIVRSLAQLMGGEVGVESVAGKGSCFWFRIPCQRVDMPCTQDPSAAGFVPTRLTASLTGQVMVVEDNPANQKVILAALANFGLDVKLVQDGQQAIDAILQNDLSALILMDLHMPVLNGYEATRQIRQWEAQCGLAPRPIIGLTADAYAESRMQCLQHGMNDVLTKPIELNALHAMLVQWLPRQSIAPLATESAPLAVEPRAINEDRIRDLIAEIFPQLAEHDFSAIALGEALQSAVAGTSHSGVMDDVVAHLAEFEFERAALSLERVAIQNGWKKNA